ncbi:MAG: ribonuclease P protein component [Patescibacteria group bacterium]
MLPKSRKLKGRDVFSFIYRTGKRIFSDYLTVYLGISQNNSKFACVISKKAGKKAITRNKLRRRSYSIINHYLPDLKERWNVILVFKKGAAELSYSELEKKILEIFKKANLFK